MKNNKSSVRRAIAKSAYLVGHFTKYLLVPRIFYRMRREHLLSRLSDDERQTVARRVAYYNRLERPTPISGGLQASKYKFPYKEKRRFTTYFFDFYDVMKYFGKDDRYLFIRGDVTEVPSVPTFVKSRPIGEDNANSVILKLNKRRHYALIDSDKPFSEKKDMLVARTTWANKSEQRRALYRQFLNHPMCNVGKTKPEPDDDMPETVKDFMGIDEQLEYKFIACVEGIDVATNLKWVMSSNSVAVSPPLKYETWFMEGTLIPNYHYIEVRPDFSDLIEKLNYYIAHPEEAEAIIAHAHEYVEQFRNRRLEQIIQLEVAKKYFRLTR